MKFSHSLMALILVFNSCALNNVAELESDRTAKSYEEPQKVNPQLLHYILLKVPINQEQEHKEMIYSLNNELGYDSLKLTSILLGKKETERDTFILIRRFGDYEEANDYMLRVNEESELKNLKHMMILSQEEYRNFVRSKSS